MPAQRQGEVWRVDCEEVARHGLDGARGIDIVPADEIERSRTFADRDRRRHWLALRIALRSALVPWIGRTDAAGPFRLGAAGRPALNGHGPSFSISHTGPLGLVAIATDSIGVDIEPERAAAIAAWRRSAIEAAAIMLAPGLALPDAPEPRFIQCWVRLEAYAKASGWGIGRTLVELGAAGARQGEPAGGDQPSSPGGPAEASPNWSVVDL
ncbi:MAG TPA: hypothetical protein PK264_12845, partial [Hyphomicrobiaceae bacterium]|nr:hypothetical protein [Hyphomicrobiaceae bacterium]